MKRFFRFALVAACAALAGDYSGTTAPVRKPRDDTDPPKHFVNSIGMRFVWIPPSNFMMGSPANEAGRDKGEIQHKVTLTKGFYMGVYTVTQEEW